MTNNKYHNIANNAMKISPIPRSLFSSSFAIKFKSDKFITTITVSPIISMQFMNSLAYGRDVQSHRRCIVLTHALSPIDTSGEFRNTTKAHKNARRSRKIRAAQTLNPMGSSLSSLVSSLNFFHYSSSNCDLFLDMAAYTPQENTTIRVRKLTLTMVLIIECASFATP